MTVPLEKFGGPPLPSSVEVRKQKRVASPLRHLRRNLAQIVLFTYPLVRAFRWNGHVSVAQVTFEDRLYPKAWGHPALRTALAEYYNSNYGTNIVPENVMVHRAPLTYRSTPNPMLL